MYTNDKWQTAENNLCRPTATSEGITFIFIDILTLQVISEISHNIILFSFDNFLVKNHQKNQIKYKYA